MRRHLILLGVALLILTSSAATPAVSQAAGEARITLFHQYVVNRYGFGIINDSLTFQNPGNATVQIPSIQLGIPDSVASRSAGLKLESDDRYTLSKSEVNGTSLYTISAAQPALRPQGESRVSLKSFVRDILNSSASSGKTKASLLLMTSPSLNRKVSNLRLLINLPVSVSLARPPAGWSSGNNNSVPFYQTTQKNVIPTASSQYYDFSAGDSTLFSPLDVFSVVRTITASELAKPQVSDTITFKNLASTALSGIKLTLLAANITNVEVVPPDQPPLLNPAAATLSGSVLQFTRSPFHGAVQPGDNYTFTLLYDLPRSFVKLSGTAVMISIPYRPPISGVIRSFVVRISLSKGLIPTNSSTVTLTDVTPLTHGRADFSYTVALGWAAEQAVPFASLLFAAAFVAVFAYKGAPAEAKKEGEPVAGSLSDVLKAFEGKIAMLNEIIDDISSRQPSAVGKEEFDEMRQRLESARGRALQRLNEAKLKAPSKRLYDLLGMIHDSEREVDRASRDLVNLYEQYYSKRMREETFRRLFPSYKRRLDTAVNHLSDYLNAAQKEGRV